MVSPRFQLAGLLPLLALVGCGDKEDSSPVVSPPDPVDADQDGWAEAEDCNDDDSAVHPGAEERCDGQDDDCDGDIDEDDAVDAPTWYADADQDGYGDPSAPTTACEQPPRTSDENGDCDDLHPDIHSGVEEHCDGVDEDCDGEVDEDPVDGSTFYTDGDGDGHGDPDQPVQACEASAGVVSTVDDCDDSEALAWSGAREVCDGVDNDCDGEVDEGAVGGGAIYVDADGDGHGDPLNPTGAEGCAGAGESNTADDCDDSEPLAWSDAPEDCSDGVDQDCDGLADCEDGECVADARCIETACADGTDEDGDGEQDCEDSDCWGTTDCAGNVRIFVGTPSLGLGALTYPGWTGLPSGYEVHIYDVPGSLFTRASSGAAWNSCVWTADHVWFQAEINDTFHSYSSKDIDVRPSRSGFAIDSGCGTSGSAFLPKRFVHGFYDLFPENLSTATAFGATLHARWYQGKFDHRTFYSPTFPYSVAVYQMSGSTSVSWP